jgi:cytochrome bd-type quinol oxidase subunit 2
MTTFVAIVTLTALAGSVYLYYKTIEQNAKQSSDFFSDGQLHYFYPEDK